ncbi:MAG TPA: isoaspartyl peptidase/L-asparaginase [Magnetospirillaceae bacterium]|jgi:isoaspartyl peptidase/L-asparaginase-like protein (Ntn-hydrolase superfamily)
MWAVGIHGGAGPLRDSDIDQQQAELESVIAWAEAELKRGARALDVVEGAVRRMEDSGQFVAGRGAGPNTEGQYELDASICDGPTRNCGAVAALAGVYPPISIARAVMERTTHVMLAGDGARRFALENGFTAIDDPKIFFQPRPHTLKADHGTVGAVAIDDSGAIAAGTSTGGTSGKRPGRVGDSPIVGAGTWADDIVGVSCTGQGEFFIRAAAAHSVAARARDPKTSLTPILPDVLAEVKALGGTGGIIAVDRSGLVTYAFTTESMRVGLASSAGQREIVIAVQ